MITAIIQARTGSTRFPHKVFADLKGKPVIWHVVERLKWSKVLENIVLATTVKAGDDSLEKWATENSIKIFRGSEEDVLDRFYNAAKYYRATTIVRITADDPFKDPDVIDSMIEIFHRNNLDFIYNNRPASFPEGMDVEIFSFGALEKAAFKANDPIEREHVTQYFYRNPNYFVNENYSYKEDISFIRLTIDTTKDLEMARVIYEHLFTEGKLFLLNDVVELLRKYPSIIKINSEEKRSLMYQNSTIKIKEL